MLLVDDVKASKVISRHWFAFICAVDPRRVCIDFVRMIIHKYIPGYFGPSECQYKEILEGEEMYY